MDRQPDRFAGTSNLNMSPDVVSSVAVGHLGRRSRLGAYRKPSVQGTLAVNGTASSTGCSRDPSAAWGGPRGTWKQRPATTMSSNWNLAKLGRAGGFGRNQRRMSSWSQVQPDEHNLTRSSNSEDVKQSEKGLKIEN
jgi:hypothetical protein